jgi:hypothetical protein
MIGYVASQIRDCDRSQICERRLDTGHACSKEENRRISGGEPEGFCRCSPLHQGMGRKGEMEGLDAAGVVFSLMQGAQQADGLPGFGFHCAHFSPHSAAFPEVDEGRCSCLPILRGHLLHFLCSVTGINVQM